MTNYSDAAQSAKRSREYKEKLQADLREAVALLRPLGRKLMSDGSGRSSCEWCAVIEGHQPNCKLGAFLARFP